MYDREKGKEQGRERLGRCEKERERRVKEERNEGLWDREGQSEEVREQEGMRDRRN